MADRHTFPLSGRRCITVLTSASIFLPKLSLPSFMSPCTPENATAWSYSSTATLTNPSIRIRSTPQDELAVLLQSQLVQNILHGAFRSRLERVLQGAGHRAESGSVSARQHHVRRTANAPLLATQGLGGASNGSGYVLSILCSTGALHDWLGGAANQQPHRMATTMVVCNVSPPSTSLPRPCCLSAGASQLFIFRLNLPTHPFQIWPAC